MAQARKFTWGATGVAVVAVIAAFVLWIAPSRQTSSAQDGARAAAAPPLISRGYTDAPAGTAVVAGDPAGGTNLVELRIKDGQKVKRDEIIAVLSNYPKADVALRMAEANLTKLKQLHDTVLMGTRVTDIALLEATLKSSIESDKLQDSPALAVGQAARREGARSRSRRAEPRAREGQAGARKDDAEERSRPVRDRYRQPAGRGRQCPPQPRGSPGPLAARRGGGADLFAPGRTRLAGRHRQDRRHDPVARAGRRRRAACRPPGAGRQGRGDVPRQSNGLQGQDLARGAHREAHAARRTGRCARRRTLASCRSRSSSTIHPACRRCWDARHASRSSNGSDPA